MSPYLSKYKDRKKGREMAGGQKSSNLDQLILGEGFVNVLNSSFFGLS